MSFVETFIEGEGGPSRVDAVLGELELFFKRQPLPRAALRLCCIGLSGGLDQEAPSWAPMNRLIDKLFEGAVAHSIVDRHKIKRFAHSLHIQRRPKHLHAYIGLMVSHMLSETPALRTEPAISEGLSVFDFPAVIERYCSTKDGKDLDVPTTKPEDKEPVDSAPKTSVPSVRLALGVTRRDLREIGQRFFNQHGRIVDKESYYACYRFSMSKPEVVKTFLTLCSPTLGIDRFTFHHVYHFKTPGGSRTTKVADGEVMNLEKAFYL